MTEKTPFFISPAYSTEFVSIATPPRWSFVSQRTSSENDHLLSCKVELDGGSRGHAGSETIRWELASVVDGEVGGSEAF